LTVTVISGITLDGVVQAPARPDEDTRDGFTHGGWAAPYGDEAATAAWGEVIARATAGGGFLLGRRTYLDFIEAWPKHRPGHQYTKTLTNTPKYVASTLLPGTASLPVRNWSGCSRGRARDGGVGVGGKREDAPAFLDRRGGPGGARRVGAGAGRGARPAAVVAVGARRAAGTAGGSKLVRPLTAEAGS
jgi:hypothetical protein